VIRGRCDNLDTIFGAGGAPIKFGRAMNVKNLFLLSVTAAATTVFAAILVLVVVVFVIVTVVVVAMVGQLKL